MKLAAAAREDEKSLQNTVPSKILSKTDDTSNISAAQGRALPAEAQSRNRTALQENNTASGSSYLSGVAVWEVPWEQRLTGHNSRE